MAKVYKLSTRIRHAALNILTTCSNAWTNCNRVQSLRVNRS